MLFNLIHIHFIFLFLLISFVLFYIIYCIVIDVFIPLFHCACLFPFVLAALPMLSLLPSIVSRVKHSVWKECLFCCCDSFSNESQKKESSTSNNLYTYVHTLVHLRTLSVSGDRLRMYICMYIHVCRPIIVCRFVCSSLYT